MKASTYIMHTALVFGVAGAQSGGRWRETRLCGEAGPGSCGALRVFTVETITCCPPLSCTFIEEWLRRRTQKLPILPLIMRTERARALSTLLLPCLPSLSPSHSRLVKASGCLAMGSGSAAYQLCGL